MAAPSPEFDERMMRRAIRLAMNGRGRVEPNPMVGCVIAKDGRVIGQGWHERFGGPHAEPNALAACTESPEGATAYVTLEPCCHTNKKTPPCVPALVTARLARVVVGCLDPNPDVNGKGLGQLRAAGIEAAGPVREAPAKQLIASFTARTGRRRPYVTLKWAESAEGKVAGPGCQPVQISNAQSRQLVHQLRSRSDAIMVGVNTILTDDPLLTARGIEGARNPSRFILDRYLRTPLDARVVQDRSVSTTVLHGYGNRAKNQHRRGDGLDRAGVHLTLVPVGEDGRLSLSHVLRRVGDAFCYDLLVEPGPTLAASYLSGPFADRLWVFRSPMRLNEPSAPNAAVVPGDWVKTGEIDLAGDTLTEYLNPASPVFFAAEPSADFILAREGQASSPGAGPTAKSPAASP